MICCATVYSSSSSVHTVKQLLQDFHNLQCYLPSIMCFRDKPLSVSALQNKQTKKTQCYKEWSETQYNALSDHISHIMKYDLINVSALFDNRQQFGWHMIPLQGTSNTLEKNYTRGSFLICKQPDETYFPPQKILVVITRLERLKIENEICLLKHPPNMESCTVTKMPVLYWSWWYLRSEQSSYALSSTYPGVNHAFDIILHYSFIVTPSPIPQ